MAMAGIVLSRNSFFNRSNTHERACQGNSVPCFYAIPEKPMAYTMTRERQGCLASYTGTVTFDDFLHVVQTIHAQDNYDTLHHVIHDLSAVTALDLSHASLPALMPRELGARYTNPHIQSAVVSPDLGMKALIMACNDQTQLGIGWFLSLQEAHGWLQPGRSNRTAWRVRNIQQISL
jgi:hypothetical protein